MPVLIALPELKRPPAGLIKIAGAWHPRRFGVLHQRKLTCIYGHPVRPNGRAWEVAITCRAKEHRHTNVSCEAQLYLHSLRGRVFWVMDVTADETETIDREKMDIGRIIEHFGVGFPVDYKRPRAAQDRGGACRNAGAHRSI